MLYLFKQINFMVMGIFNRENTRTNFAGSIVALVFTILFHVPLGGISGFMILAEAGGWSMVLAIGLQLLALGWLTLSVYHYLKGY